MLLNLASFFNAPGGMMLYLTLGLINLLTAISWIEHHQQAERSILESREKDPNRRGTESYAKDLSPSTGIFFIISGMVYVTTTLFTAG